MCITAPSTIHNSLPEFKIRGLRKALDSVLAGKPVEKAETRLSAAPSSAPENRCEAGSSLSAWRSRALRGACVAAHG
jgi:hypothetical protein